MRETLRILLIDDNPDDRILVIRELKRDFDELRVEQVIDMEDFEHALERFSYDLVITDYQLHWSNGLNVLQAVKEGWPRCPVIMFTATGTEEVAVEAMKNGLDDYILKSPRHFSRLPVAVRKVLDSAQERLSRERAEHRYRELAESITDVFFAVDRELRYTYWNRASEELTGIPADEALGRSIYELFPGESGIRAADFYREVLRSQRSDTFTNRHYISGRERWFEINAYPTSDGLVVFSRDITEKKNCA
ncbi:MAG: PAS domain-containing protein [Actinomycetota bacterium]